MKRSIYITFCALFLFMWFWPPVAMGQIMVEAIRDDAGNEIDPWLPEPFKRVTIKLNVTISSLRLLPATTNYPGICTNVGANDPGYDFEIVDGSINGDSFQLSTYDSGGIAYIEVTSAAGVVETIALPQDNDGNMIADSYEIKWCGAAACLNPDEDEDDGPGPGTALGDGHTAINEARGFQVAGKIVRPNPFKKDLFIQVHNTIQCADTNAKSLVDYFGDPPTEAFAYLNTLMGDMDIHYITKSEWDDRFSSYSPSTGVQMEGVDVFEQIKNAKYDRRINSYALPPHISSTNEGIVKGVRFIECQDTNSDDPLGLAGKGPPDGWDRSFGNAIVFTQRVIDSLLEKIGQGPNRSLRYYTYVRGVSSLQWESETCGPTSEDNNLIIRAALPWYVAHETAGHCLDLTPKDESTKKEVALWHHVSGTGTNIDNHIVHTVDRKNCGRGYNNFYIPKYFGPSDKDDIRLLQNQ